MMNTTYEDDTYIINVFMIMIFITSIFHHSYCNYLVNLNRTGIQNIIDSNSNAMFSN